MSFRSFFDKFPPPEYLNVPYVGLVFSDLILRVLMLDSRSKHPTFFSEIAVPPGVIESGVIKSPKDLSILLSKLRSELKTPFIKFVIPDEISYVFTTSLPVVTGKDLGESIEFILEENVPLPLSDISFDFTPTSVNEVDPKNITATASVTAISSVALETYESVLRTAGFEPILAINESQSIARSIVPFTEKGNIVIVSAKGKSVSVYITKGSVVEFSFNIPVSDKKGDDYIDYIMTEFEKAVNYWKEKTGNKNNNLEKVIVCGRYEVSKPVFEKLSVTAGMPVSFGNVWINAFPIDKYIPEISFEDSLKYAPLVSIFL